MGSLGKATKRAFLKAANDGAPKKHRMVALPEAKNVGKKQLVNNEGVTKEGLEEGKYVHSKANDNAEDGKKALQRLRAEDAKMSGLFELIDAGDLFALNKYAKKHFGIPWSKLKQEAAIQDML